MDWSVNDVGVISCSGESGPTPSEIQFEIGDWHSFASLTAVNSYSIKHNVKECSSTSFIGNHRIEMDEGIADIFRKELFSDNKIDREICLRTPSGLALGDLVARFVFEDERDSYAMIAGEQYDHRGLNRYYQFPTDTATIYNNIGSFTVKAIDSDLPDGLQLFTYVRDEPPDKWIIHIRALSINADSGMVRLSYLPVTHLAIIDRIVERLPRLRKHMRYVRERSLKNSRWLPAQYVELTHLDPTDTVSLKVTGVYE